MLRACTIIILGWLLRRRNKLDFERNHRKEKLLYTLSKALRVLRLRPSFNVRREIFLEFCPLIIKVGALSLEQVRF